MNKDLFNKFFRNKDGQFVIAQKPNVPIIVWIICVIGSYFFTGTINSIFNFVGVVAIIIWSLLEIFLGVNYFRRLLGLVVLIFAVFVKFL
jgi:hypothetical protein